MIKHDEKKIEEIREAWSKGNSGEELSHYAMKQYSEHMVQQQKTELIGILENDFESNDDLLTRSMIKYSDKMVQQERERVLKITKKVSLKNDSNGRYNACIEIINLINKEDE